MPKPGMLESNSMLSLLPCGNANAATDLTVKRMPRPRLGSAWEANSNPLASTCAESDCCYALVLGCFQGCGDGMGNNFHRYRFRAATLLAVAGVRHEFAPRRWHYENARRSSPKNSVKAAYLS